MQCIHPFIFRRVKTAIDLNLWIRRVMKTRIHYGQKMWTIVNVQARRLLLLIKSCFVLFFVTLLAYVPPYHWTNHKTLSQTAGKGSLFVRFNNYEITERQKTCTTPLTLMKKKTTTTISLARDRYPATSLSLDLSVISVFQSLEKSSGNSFLASREREKNWENRESWHHPPRSCCNEFGLSYTTFYHFTLIASSLICHSYTSKDNAEIISLLKCVRRLLIYSLIVER